MIFGSWNLIYLLQIDDRSGAPYLNGAANGLGNSLPPSSAPVNDISPEAYCRRHEITVSVSIFMCRFDLVDPTV